VDDGYHRPSVLFSSHPVGVGIGYVPPSLYGNAPTPLTHDAVFKGILGDGYHRLSVVFNNQPGNDDVVNQYQSGQLTGAPTEMSSRGGVYLRVLLTYIRVNGVITQVPPNYVPGGPIEPVVTSPAPMAAASTTGAQYYTDTQLDELAQANNVPANAIRVRTTSGGAVWILPGNDDVVAQYQSGELTGAPTEMYTPGGVYLRVVPTYIRVNGVITQVPPDYVPG